MMHIFLFISVLAAYFVKAITGFGNTLVMGSLFAFIMPNALITPIDLVLGMPTNIYIAWRERKNISLKVVIPLALMLLIGIIPGTFILKMGGEGLLKSIFGVVVAGIGIEMLIRNTKKSEVKKSNPALLIMIGLSSGVLAGLYGIGALLVAYIGRITPNKNQFRANICCVFLVENIFRFILYGYTGLLNKQILSLVLILSPAVILGMMMGIKVDKYVSEVTMRKAIIVLLIISGIVLFLKNILIN
ncbi:sulfite exporter TauE/SafE family protein [Cellulosilyticum sp. I15G10I2]|uniref:sulfite exporter TauE/SafE family protein n=1 Tax=Cellulosilyticum sp. I15G10I2 TaxID=1892843 RepID=UPI00085CBA01|nr:sulfite exporter TauE/SafE family protein [Cellulosilyticum sp. I15G10I2]